MRYMQKGPNPSGAYPGIQTLDFQPKGWLPLADDCDDGAMTTHRGYVTPTIEDDVVISITGDDAAYQAYLASLPAPAAAEPDAITQTQIALAELAETESAHDIENKLALAELAEMMGGTTNG